MKLQHTCTAACHDGQHAELVYTDIGGQAAIDGIRRWWLLTYGLRLTAVRPAPEAPAFDHFARLGLRGELTPLNAHQAPSDAFRWLVWFDADEEAS